MNKGSVILLLFTFALIVVACSSSKTKNSTPPTTPSRMEFTVTKIQDEKDGQTLFMKDDKGGAFTTIISIPNGNFVELKAGDRISLLAKEIMESDPAQIISKDIKVIGGVSFIKTIISTDKESYAPDEKIMLSFEVKNTSSSPFTFLPWQTPLEQQFTGDCMLVTRDGSPVRYSGIMVKRMPPTEEDYLTLKGNDSASAEINLLTGYKLTETGVYKIQFKESYQGLPASKSIEVTIE